MTYLKKIKIVFSILRPRKYKKIQKKPRSKIGIAAVMPMNKNREKKSKIERGESFLV
jgi:hypothetical protein